MLENRKIFVVEDEGKIRDELTKFLKQYGYLVEISTDFKNMVSNILESNPHIVLLDITLPYYDGYCICREIREKSNIPIIVVTNRRSDIDELMSSNLGTEYFITKPYNTHTLLDIMASILKRNYSINDMEIFEHNGLKYNMSTSQICFKGDEVELTKKESNILYTLIKNKGKIVSRDTIIKYLCQSNEFIDNSTLTINVNRLRRKIAGIGADGYLKTKRGKGYILL